MASSTAQIPYAVQPPCDELDSTRCAYPYPNDYLSLPGAGTTTGRRLGIGPKVITAVGNGQSIIPDRWNETDGFSVGPMILSTT